LHLITLNDTQTLGRTLLARRKVLYLTTYNTYNRQVAMPHPGLEPAFPVSEQPQTHALRRAATGIGLS